MKLRQINASDLALQKQLLLVALWTPDDEPTPQPHVLEVPHIKEFFVDWGREGDLGYFAFDEQDNPAGIVQVRYKSSPTSMHRNLPELALAVLPEYRGQGVGLKLMEHILAQVEKTADGVRLGVHPKNKAAINLYHRFGFDVYEIAQSGYPQMVRIRNAKSIK